MSMDGKKCWADDCKARSKCMVNDVWKAIKGKVRVTHKYVYVCLNLGHSSIFG